MPLKKTLVSLLVVAITVALVWFIFNNKPTAKKMNAPKAQSIKVEAISPASEKYQIWVPSYGIVKPKTQSQLIAQISGQVIKVSDQFREGAFFSKGDELLVIDDADYLAALAIAKAELKQAEFTYQEEVASAELAVKDWYKLGNKKEPPSLVARKPQLNSALFGLEANKAKVIQAELNFKRTKIIAPFDGRVLSLDVNVGQVVSNGTLLGSVFATDSVEVRLPIKQNDLAYINLPETYRDVGTVGQTDKTQVLLHANIGLKQQNWQAELVRVEGVVDEQTRQIFVVVEVNDPYKFISKESAPLKVGQFVNAKIQGIEIPNTVVLPRAAVSASNTINIIEDGLLQRTSIQPLWQDEHNIIINNEFKPNQKISITPLNDSVSGTQVEIIDQYSQQPSRKPKNRKQKNKRAKP